MYADEGINGIVSAISAVTPVGQSQTDPTHAIAGPNSRRASTDVFDSEDVTSSPSRLFQASVEHTADAIRSGSLSNMSFAALGSLGDTVVVAERLIASMPPNLGTSIDTQA